MPAQALFHATQDLTHGGRARVACQLELLSLVVLCVWRGSEAGALTGAFCDEGRWGNKKMATGEFGRAVHRVNEKKEKGGRTPPLLQPNTLAVQVADQKRRKRSGRSGAGWDRGTALPPIIVLGGDGGGAVWSFTVARHSVKPRGCTARSLVGLRMHAQLCCGGDDCNRLLRVFLPSTPSCPRP